MQPLRHPQARQLGMLISSWLRVLVACLAVLAQVLERAADGRSALAPALRPLRGVERDVAGRNGLHLRGRAGGFVAGIRGRPAACSLARAHWPSPGMFAPAWRRPADRRAFAAA